MAFSLSRIAKLLVFYSIFYTILAVLCAVWFHFFLKTLNETQPKWQLDSSLIGDSPGLTFRPSATNGMIAYNSTNFYEHTKQLKEFLHLYLCNVRPEKSENCQFKNELSSKDKFCDFKINTSFIPCLPEFNFGFDRKGLCVFFKLNKIFGWKPKFYSSPSTIPDDMPHDLVEHIFSKNKEQVWLDCRGVNDIDKANLGSITYYPSRGFQKKYFPYRNIKGQLSPLVAVHFEKPKNLVAINIECKAWASNIRHDAKSGHGVVRFSILLNE